MEDKRLVLVGGGGHCKSVLDTILCLGTFNEIVITDQTSLIGSTIMGCKVVGNDDILPYLYYRGIKNAFITVGSIKSTRLRCRLYELIKSIGFNLPNIIDPTAAVSESAKLGKGIFIGKNAVVNCCAEIGDLAIINTGSVVEHECVIGALTHLSVNATICGQSSVGANSFIGAGATIIQGIQIGSHAVIGAGSVVLEDVGSNKTVYGVVKSK